MALSIEERRQSFYATLLRFTPESGALRERVIDRLVLVALLDTKEDAPLSAGKVKSNIKLGHHALDLRIEVIQEVLGRLVYQGKVGRIEYRKKPSYYLKKDGLEDITHMSDSAASLFKPVLEKMLKDTEVFLPREKGELVCRRFIAECFARFGQHIAKMVTVNITKDNLFNSIDLRIAFQAAIKNISLTREVVESLEARCFQFLRSSERDDEDLKFRLTQGYYIAQLFELNTSEFNPIADDAFSGAILFLDTNVVMPRFLSIESAGSFDELIRINKKLGIEVKITKATIDEIRMVLANSIENLEVVIDTLPEELTEKTKDDILLAFLKARKDNSKLTPREFIQQFDTIREQLEVLGLHIEDQDLGSIVLPSNFSQICDVINSSALDTRGWGKSEVVQQHDAFHYLIVMNLREEGHKVWFLSQDRTLSVAGARLSKGHLSFCYPLVGFLQSISPFLENAEEESSLADLFSATLSGDICGLPSDKFFDLKELKLIAELHEDVLSTPSEEIVMAFDYIKSKVLNGQPYKKEEHHKVALELKKFLSSTAQERERAFQLEAARQRDLALLEARKREEAEQDILKIVQEKKELEEKLKKAEYGKKDADYLIAQFAKTEGIRNAVLMIIGYFLCITLWSLDMQFAKGLSEVYIHLTENIPLLQLLIRGLGSVLLVVAALPIILSLNANFRTGALIAVIAFALGGARIVGDDSISKWSNLLGVAAPISLFVIMYFDRRKNVSG